MQKQQEMKKQKKKNTFQDYKMKQNEAKMKREELLQERKKEGFCFFLEKGERKGLIPVVTALSQAKIPLNEVLEGRQARNFALKGMDYQRKLHKSMKEKSKKEQDIMKRKDSFFKKKSEKLQLTFKQ